MERIKQGAHKALRASERLFKTDMVYLAKGGFWLTFLQVVSAISSFILAVGFAHFLSKDTYGTYKYIMSIGGILTAFSLTGLSTAVTNAAARGQDGTLRFAFKKNFSWGLITLLIFLLASAYYATHGNSVLALGLIIIGIVTPLLGSASLADAFLVGKKDFRRSALTSGGAIFLVNAATLGAAFLSGNIIVLVATYMFASTLVELVIYLYTVRVYSPHGGEVDPEAASYGAHLSLIGIINTLVDRLDSVLTFHFLGPAELAIYSFAIAIPEQLKGLMKNVSSLAQPKFSESGIVPAYRSMRRKITIMTATIAVIILVYIVLAPYIFEIFFPQYAGTGVFFSRVYVITLIPSAALLPVTLLQAVAAKRELYLFNVTGGIFQIIAMFLGTSLYGILGLIIAIGLSRTFRLVYSWVLLKNLYDKEQGLKPSA